MLKTRVVHFTASQGSPAWRRLKDEMGDFTPQHGHTRPPEGPITLRTDRMSRQGWHTPAGQHVAQWGVLVARSDIYNSGWYLELTGEMQAFRHEHRVCGYCVTTVLVSARRLYFSSGGHSYTARLPSEGSRFVQEFDLGKDVQPFSFLVSAWRD